MADFVLAIENGRVVVKIPGSDFVAELVAQAEAARDAVKPLSGNGPPAPGLGIVGSLYFDTSAPGALVAYGPKTEDGWGAGHPVGSRGPQGYSAGAVDQLRAAPFSDGPLMHRGLVWVGKNGDYSVGDDARGIVKQADTPLAEGAWVASFGVAALEARTDGNGVSTASVEASIADANNRGAHSIYKPPGLMYIGTPLSELNPYGLRLWGDGILLERDEAAPTSLLDTQRLVGSYADEMDYVIGREYMTTVVNVMAAGQGTLKGSMFGDSTTGDFAIPIPDYVPHRLLMTAARNAGFTSVDIKNNFVNGSVTPMMDLSLIRAEDHVIFINYGVNDMGQIGDAIGIYRDNLDAKLANIREDYPYSTATMTDGSTKDIVLLLPNSCNSWEDGRGQFRYEQLRGVHAMLSRKHKVAIVDKYAFMQDSTNAYPWMDSSVVPNQGNVHIHPTVLGNDKLWSVVARAVFGEFVGPKRANLFHNIDQYEPIQAARLPSEFVRGITLGRCGAGYPITSIAGYVRTEHHADGLVSQTVFGYSPGGAGPPEIVSRMNNGAGTWGPWSNAWTVIAGQNGWAGAGANLIRADTDGRLRGLGALAGGNKAPGTVVFTLPPALRPAISDRFMLAGDAGPVRLLLIAETGEVSLEGETLSNTIYLSGMVGTVAGR